MPKTNDTDFIQLIRARYGFNDQLIEQYGHFVVHYLSFDFGYSLDVSRGAEVTRLMGDALVATCLLFSAVLVLSLLLGAFFEAVTRRMKRRTSRGLMRIVALALVSTPLVGLVLLLVHLNAWADTPMPVWRYPGIGHVNSLYGALVDIGRSVFPVAIAALSSFGLISAMTKANPWTEMASETSIAEDTRTVIKEVLRNHWFSRFFFAWVLMATLGIEVVFWDRGLGALLFEAIRVRDGPVFMALFYVLSLMLALLNFAVGTAMISRNQKDTHDSPISEAVAGSQIDSSRPRKNRAMPFGFLRGLWADYSMSRSGVAALAVIVFFIAVALLAPVISTVKNPTNTDNLEPNDAGLQYFNPLPPSLDRSPLTDYLHPFGTDLNGGDIWSLTWYGARMPVLTGAIVFAFSLAIGLVAGITGVALGALKGRGMKTLSWFGRTLAEAFVAVPLVMLVGGYRWGHMELWGLALLAIVGFYGWGWFYIASEAKRNRWQTREEAKGLRDQVIASLLPITRNALFVAKFAVPAILIAMFSVEMLGSYYGPWESWGRMVDTYFSWNVFCSCRTWWQLLFPVLAISALTTSTFVTIDTFERVARTREARRTIPKADGTIKAA
jgi:ABC-type dipeptide/oligopeptide/nickel transport system permease component/ABC-type dipeptide/oligopeptide/nickel transport system permease subunit